MNPYDYLKEKDIIGKPLSYTKEFCPLLNLEPKRGNAKNLQLNKIMQYCEIENADRKLIIRRIYNEDEIKFTLKEALEIFIKEHFKGDINDFNACGGIYKIQRDDYVYIGQTNNFRRRLNEHKSKQSSAYHLLEQGGELTIVEVENDLKSRLAKEKDYIRKYSKDEGYICINVDNNYKIYEDRRNKLVSLKVRSKDLEKAKELLDRGGVKYYDKQKSK